MTEAEKTHKVKLALSRTIRSDAEGSFLRELIFHEKTVLPERAVIGKMLGKHFPEMISTLKEITE